MNDPANSAVEMIRERLGRDVVLIPIPKGQKYPAIKKWQSVPLSSMDDPKWIARLNRGNIGALLGNPSNGLCSIDLDNDEDMEPFLALNPRLRQALRTRRARGGNIWVRVRGKYPSLAKLQKQDGSDFGEWRSTGGQTVIYGEAGGVQYTIVQDGKPAELSFSEIIWPPEVVNPFLPNKAKQEAEAQDNCRTWAELKDKYGAPYYTNDKGTVTAINESFWAGLDAEENLGLFEPDEATHYSYNPKTGLFDVTSAAAIKTRISERLLQVSREMKAFGVERKGRTAGVLSAIESHLQGINERRHAFVKDRHFVHLANGVMVFRDDGEADLMPFSPEYRSRNASPIAFDINADCPRFMDTLLLPAVSTDDALLIQKYAGVCLYGNNIIQRMLILDGLAGRGKTQLANVIQKLVGLVNATQLRTEHLAERFELFRFLRKTLLVGVDVPANFLSTKGAAVLKGLVGGDYFDAERKGSSECFQMQGTFCVIVTSNSRLRIRLEGDLGAWKRRLMIVRYEAPPPEKKIPDFGAVLIREEGPGILNWALQGLAAVLEEVRAHGDVILTPRQAGVVDSLLAESESLRHFLVACVERSEGDDDLTVAEITEAYAEYCPAMGWKALPLTIVHEQLDGLMLELFGTTKRHDIPREGRKLRGFGRVHFKPEAANA